MTTPHAYPGTWNARYDQLQAAAMKAGLCPKILVTYSSMDKMHACGRPRTKGLYCERHQR